MTKSGMKGDIEGSLWITKGRTEKLLESSHMSREETGVGGRHVPEMTNLGQQPYTGRGSSRPSYTPIRRVT